MKGRPIADLTGRRFGRWTVLRLHERRPKKNCARGGNYIIWLCRCDCGEELPVWAGNLIAGYSKQCQPCSWAANVKHEIGARLGTRTLIAFDEGVSVWRCACGSEVRQHAATIKHNLCRACTDRSDDHGRMLTINGETHNLAGWARKIGVTREAVRIRLKQGMPFEAACTTPRRPSGRKAAA